MKIKVCGMRNSENVSSLLVLKPDFVGFIFYNKSKRFVADFPEVEFPSDVKKVGVFVNESEGEIIKKVNQYQLDFVQLHGDETPQFCDKLKSSQEVKIIKAFSVDGKFDFDETKAFENYCSYFLFDTKGVNYGGNGIKFNWEILQNYKGNIPFLLSGGISKNDVLEVNKINHLNFIGVDVNSGFEIEPALKNIEKLKEFKNNLV
ncbi:MAG: phosphoribosylanthranilate isomerase [Lutibacter sp.]|uniref:phosphoribosylanthranilate isomerase n=1 Tax=Lutibacter sp. TaxID=1925666 RepID=UPI001A037E8A|nr:phosphoribosylanthranilate isomerase [Lutibacter sp.]NOR27849.1 phosphoribosylanthranilate isomerase [Lutibacter sp.]